MNIEGRVKRKFLIEICMDIVSCILVGRDQGCELLVCEVMRACVCSRE